MTKKITLTVVDRKGCKGCAKPHKIGDTFDYDADKAQICPRVVYVAFPYVDILKHGGTPPCKKSDGRMLFSCPDCDVLNIFEIKEEIIE